ncbi:MAG TPA: hypothetical protein VGH33_22600 [Isosphaeraceae bacterium]
MIASASIAPGDVALVRPPVQVGVFRLIGDQYEPLPNIEILTIQSSEGADPGAARFRYVFDPLGPADEPQAFEQAMAVDGDLPGVVQNDDRLVVMTVYPDGSPLILFDGFAQVPELSYAPSHELVTFSAFGVAVREWDTPVGGALVRDADDPTGGADTGTDLVTYFNPQGEPNATPAGADAEDASGNTYPTFLDPLVVRDPDVRRAWTLPMAIRYLCYHENADQTYVLNPAGDAIDALLDSRTPDEGAGLDLTAPSNYASEPLEVPDYPATGKAWPNVVEDLLRPNGFWMAFRLATDGGGLPSTALDLFRLQDSSPAVVKDLYLQTRGSALDPAQTNMSAARLSRDMTGVANAYSVESQLIRYEASFVLAPGFPIAAADSQSAASLAAFNLNDPAFSSTNHDKYRLYVFDETGEGHWDWPSSSIVTTVAPLDSILAGDDPDNTLTYTRRRRVPLGELFTLDPNRKPLRAQLSISTDFAGEQPAVWDGSGTWQPIHGGFELLRDRLGIWINVANPNGWAIGPSSVASAPFPSGVVRGIEAQTAAIGKKFALRLTCVIEGDQIIPATADRRPSSPTAYQVLRRVDARDRYFKHAIAPNSEFNATDSFVTSRDDTQDALAEADARRLAGESGEVRGAVTIPRFTNAYQIGDRIRSIVGRNLSLRTNAGAPTEEGEVYPAVVGLTWDFDGKQHTILRLSDQRGLRP